MAIFLNIKQKNYLSATGKNYLAKLYKIIRYLV